MKPLLILVFAAVLLMPLPVVAADFSVNLTMDNSYLVNRSGTATVLIQNSGVSDWFGVSILGIDNWAQILPSGSRIWVDAGYVGNATIYINPPANADPKMYSFSIEVTRSSTKAKIERQLLLQVDQLVDAQMVNFTKDCTECEGEISFALDVQNLGTEPFAGTLTATIAGVPRGYQLEISKDSAQHVSDIFDLTGFKPGDYVMQLDLNSSNRHVQTINQDFKVAGVENVTYEKLTSSSIFGNSVVLTATNIGNVPLNVTLNAVITKLWYSIYSGPAPTQVVDNRYKWAVELAGGGNAKIAYTEINWPLPIIIIALIIVGLFFYLKYASLSVKKAALGRTVITPGRDIGISLSVKNTRRKADSISVREHVPSAFTVGGKFDTVKPIIRKTHTGTEIIWKFNDVSPGEERMIHYKITPNTQVYGSCVLSPALARARFGNRMLERKSNSIVLEGAPKGGVHKLSIEVDK